MGQGSSLVVHWLSVSGGHGSNPGEWENIFLFRFNVKTYNSQTKNKLNKNIVI